MFKKRIIIISLLLFLASQSNFAFGEFVCPDRDPNSAWWLSMDEWKSTAKNGLWADPCNWSNQRPQNPAPPDCNTWACISPNLPGPAIWTDAQCSRLSMYPWSWEWGGTDSATDCNVRGGLFDCGICIDVAGKGNFSAAPPGQEWGPGVLNVYAGTMITPVAQTWGGEGDINGLWVGGSMDMNNVYNTAIVNIYGGLVSVPRIAIYNGQINLYGGLLEGLHGPHTDTVGADHNDFYISDLMPTNRLNVAGGTLILAGNWTEQVNYYIQQGRICPFGEQNALSVVYNSAPEANYTSVTAVWAGAYVDCNAIGDNNGSSWANAYNYLQDALDEAASGYGIWVAQGTYRPDENSVIPDGSDWRGATFQLKNGVAIYGGFPTGGGEWSSRDPNLYKTTLSGDINIADFNNDNSYHVVTGSGTDSSAILDGFNIIDGNANGSWLDCLGGGMYNYFGSPTITNCTFNSNLAKYYGGGIYDENSSPTLTNCMFSGNSAGEGGGMANFYGRPALINCTFNGNSATYDGGGIYDYNSNPTLTNCTFIGNSTTYYGGGMSNFFDSNPILTDCIFSGNSANCGSAIYIMSGCSPTLNDCTFSGNSKIQGTGDINIAYGGEIVVEDNAVVDLNEPNEPELGTIHCNGLIKVKDNGQLKNATVNISRQGDGYFGKLKVENSAQATNLDIHTDGDRFMDVDPCTFTGTIANNRIYVTITEGQNDTPEGKLEVRGRDFTVPPCPGEPNCQIDESTMPDFNTTSWTLERLELAPGARVALVDRFSSGNGDHEVLYVKDLVLGADSNLNYGFERFYFTNIYGDSNSIIKGAFFGFSLGDINLDSNEEFESRIINNNYINPEDPCSNRIYVERVVGLEPEPNGMMKMSNLEDTNGQIISARAKSEFAPCNEDEIRIRLNYLFTTTDPNTRIVIYLSDIPEMGDLNDANHYKEVAQIPNPPVPRPGSAGSGRYGNFEMFVSTWGLDLTNGTWIELVLVEPQSHFLRYGGAKGMETGEGEHGVVFTSGMGAGAYCYIGVCLDLDWSYEPDVGDFLIVVSGAGKTDPTCADGAFSSDGYDDSYDSDSWDWTINLEGRKNMCINVPMRGAAKFAGGGGFMHLNGQLNLINPSDLNDLLISGKRGTEDQSTKMKDRHYVFNSSPHYLRLLEPVLENRNIRVVRGEANDLYQINSRDGITRLDDGNSIVPSNGGGIDCPNEPRYKGNATVYVGIQDTGDASFGRPIFDAAFNANDTNVYVVPVVVVPDGDDPYDENLPYAAAAKLHLTPGYNPPYQLVKLYDDPPLTGDNQRQYRNTLREIELDDACNVYVTNAHAFNACDILWKFEPNEAVRRLDLDPCDPCKTHVRGPTGMCVSSATKVLYLTSSLYNEMDPNSKIIYGFSTVDFNLVRTITVHEMQHVTGITEDPSTRALWVTGFNMNCELPRFPSSPSPIAGPFYDPYLAKVPVGVNDVNAVCILDANDPNYDLAMPLSIVWTGSRVAQEKCGGADLNKDGNVTLADLAKLAHYWLYTNCAALNNCEGADLQPEQIPDGDVDIGDLDILTEHWLYTNCQ